MKAQSQASKQSWWVTSDAEGVGPGHGIVRVISPKKKRTSKDGNKQKHKIRASQLIKFNQLRTIVALLPAVHQERLKKAPHGDRLFTVAAAKGRETVRIDKFLEGVGDDQIEALGILCEAQENSEELRPSTVRAIRKLRVAIGLEREARTQRFEAEQRQAERQATKRKAKAALDHKVNQVLDGYEPGPSEDVN